MKRLFFLLAMMSFSLVQAQRIDSLDTKNLSKEIDSSRKVADSLLEAQNKRINDRMLEQSLKQNERNLDNFMAARREQEKKQQKQNWIRIAIGVVFAIILIVGLRRKRKAKAKAE